MTVLYRTTQYLVWYLFCIFFLIPFGPVHSQTKPQDLPFDLHEDKQMSEKKVQDKKEGFYATGIPIISSDPVTGQGGGVQFSLFENGKKNEPLFAFQPYKYGIFGQVFNTNKNAQSHYLALDVPYINNTPYRLQLDTYYQNVNDSPYFGVGESTLQPLSYRRWNQPFGQTVRNARYADYEQNKTYIRRGKGGEEGELVTDRNYNIYDFETLGGNITLDRTFWRAYRFGFNQEFSKNIIHLYDGKWTEGTIPGFPGTISVPSGQTLIGDDIQRGRFNSISRGTYLNYSRVYLVYDTRDFELDPCSGFFAEISGSFTGRANGSDATFQKYFAQLKYFYMPFPKVFEEFVLSFRSAVQTTKGDTPFFDYRYVWSVDNPMNALGGFASLRGYRQDRFVGSVVGFGNFEARWRFATLNWGEELFQFSFVPFYDTGRVWDRMSGMGFSGYKYSYGAGFRIIWNVATVIAMDYGKSDEDAQFFINMGHQF